MQSYLQIGWIAAGRLVAVTTNDDEKDEENQNQREVVKAIKNTHLLTPPTLDSITMLCRWGESCMGGCHGSFQIKLYTSYPQKNVDNFNGKRKEKYEKGKNALFSYPQFYPQTQNFYG